MEKVGDILKRLSTPQGGADSGIDFKRPVKFASDCSECPSCGEPWCDECGAHYADCSCPGPHSEPEEA